MKDGYGSKKDYMDWVKDSADERQEKVKQSLRKAFKDYIEVREVEVIIFSQISAEDIGKAILEHPSILKPLLAICNIGGRAIERDVGIKNVSTYDPSLNRDEAMQISGYIKQFLPKYVEIPSLTRLDRVYFIDKEIRKRKGRWEKIILKCLNGLAGNIFKKRHFISSGEKFELDAAYPKSDKISIGIDIKRIEARRDIHKRTDEIVNKARKLKLTYPDSYFIAIIYYPFIDEHVNIQNRLKSEEVDEVVFASQAEDNIKNSCRMLLSSLINKDIISNLEDLG